MLRSNEINGIQYVIHNKDDSIQNTLVTGLQWNDEIINIIKSYIKQKSLVHFLNVGAHIGSVSLPISLHINTVTAFEPYPNTYNYLCENIKLNKLTNINTYNIALGNSDEDIYFMSEYKIDPFEKINRIKNNSGGMHIFTEDDISNNTRSSYLTDKIIKNRVTKLDNFEIDNFDIMLIDIEGSEFNFLLGAREKIIKNKPIIIIEIWNDDKRLREKMTTTQYEVITYIKSLNYNLIQHIGDDYIFEPFEA